MKNKALYTSILSVKSLDSLGAKQYLEYVTVLRNIAGAADGPFGIGIFNGSDLYTLNAHILTLYARHGKDLPGTRAFLDTHKGKYSPTPGAPSSSPPQTSLASKSALPSEYEASYEMVLASLHRTQIAIRKVALEFLQKIKKVDHSGEISLLAFYFGSGLQHKNASLPALYTTLGAANIFTWLAYTLYDTILDGEIATQRANHSQLLLAANICLREASRLYALAAPASEWPQRLFGEVDAAFAQEIAQRNALAHNAGRQSWAKPSEHRLRIHKRLLASKSIAHCIGPLLIAEKVAPATQSAVERALRHYCAARQLNDDLHDWQSDIQAGQHQYVVARLLRDTSATDSSPASLKQLQHTFWNTTLQSLLKEQRYMLAQSRKLLHEAGISDTSATFFSVTLAPIELSHNLVHTRNSFERQLAQLLPSAQSTH